MRLISIYEPRKTQIIGDIDLNLVYFYNRYITQDQQINGDGFDATNLIDYDINQVKSWNDLVYYSQLFLQGKIPRTVFHDGVYASETLLILKFLQDIHTLNYITLDSQPGCIIEDTPLLIQLPYLRLVGPMDMLQSLILTINDPYIGIWIEQLKPINSLLTTLLPQLHLDMEYGSLYLSVEYKDNLEYILSDQFFRNIILAMSQLPTTAFANTPSSSTCTAAKCGKYCD